jgi:hypothetical protein
VGRRRLLQGCLRKLRTRDAVGLVLQGTGGLGKSSVAGRLCDRLKVDSDSWASSGSVTNSRLCETRRCERRETLMRPCHR